MTKFQSIPSLLTNHYSLYRLRSSQLMQVPPCYLLGKGKRGCTGGKGDGECCESDDPEDEKCEEGQGDCDKDDGCAGDLVCGKNNCREYHKDAGPKEDCCRKPNTKNGNQPQNLHHQPL